MDQERFRYTFGFPEMASNEEQEQEQEEQEQEEQEVEKPKAKNSKAEEKPAQKKAERKTRKKKKSRGKYTVSISKAFMMARLNTDVSSEAMEIVTSFVNNFVEVLAVEAARLANEAARFKAESNTSNKRAEISTRDIDVAIPLILARS